MRALGQLGIPIFYQEKSYSCGAAAVRSVVSYLTGLDIPEQALRTALKTNPEMGTDPGDIVAFLSRLPNLRVRARTMTVEDLRRCVDNGEIVIVDLQAWSEEKNPDWRKTWLDGHYVVLSGYKGERFLFADPSSEKSVFLDASILEQRWHDEDAKGLRSERLGIVCTPRVKTMQTASQRRVGRIFSLRVAALNAFRDREAAARVATKFLQASPKLLQWYPGDLEPWDMSEIRQEIGNISLAHAKQKYRPTTGKIVTLLRRGRPVAWWTIRNRWSTTFKTIYGEKHFDPPDDD